MSQNRNAAGRWSRGFRKDAEAAAVSAISVRVREVGFSILQQLVVRSPVDTGAFRAHWNVAFGGPGTREFSESFVDLSGGITIGAGLAELAGLPASMPDIYFTNPTPYGPALENGWSPQAPSGIVGPTLASYLTGVP